VRAPPLVRLFPYTTLFRSRRTDRDPHQSTRLPGGVVDRVRGLPKTFAADEERTVASVHVADQHEIPVGEIAEYRGKMTVAAPEQDRKSTRLNSSHVKISYA